MINKQAVANALAQIDPAERENWLADVELRAMTRNDRVVLDAIDDWRRNQSFQSGTNIAPLDDLEL